MINYDSGVAYVALAKNISAVYMMLESIMPKVNDDSLTVDDFFNDLVLAAYVSRVGIIELLEKHKWNPDGFIFIDVIDSAAIPLTFALENSVQRVIELGKHLHVDAYTSGIIEKKEIFYQYEKIIPDEFKTSLFE